MNCQFWPILKWFGAMLAFFCVVAPWLYAGMFAHPVADDYSYSLYTSFWQYQWRMYTTWTGNFVGTLLASFNPWHWGSLFLVRLALLAGILFFALSVVYFYFHLLGRIAKLSAPIRVLFGVSILAAIFNLSPALSEGFYWYTSAAVYIIPFACYLLAAGFWLSKGGRGNLCLLLLILSTAGSPLQMVINALTILSFGSYLLLITRSFQKSFWRYALAVGIPALVVIIAPGNLHRHEVIGSERSVASAMSITWEVYYNYWLPWLRNPSVAILCFISFIVYTSLNQFVKPGNLLYIWISAQLIVIVCLAISGYLTGTLPPGRVLNILGFIQLLALPMLLISIIHALSLLVRKVRLPYFVSTATASRILLVMVSYYVARYGMYQKNNYKLLHNEYSSNILCKYDEQYMKRYSFIRNAEGTNLVVHPAKIVSNILFVSDLESNPFVWPNTDYAMFWKKKAISADTLYRHMGYQVQP